jgi:hypothetical protein
MNGSFLSREENVQDFKRPGDFNLIIELRSRIRLSLDLIPSVWPLRTFIHHNPLHGLEDLPFEDAVAQGSTLFRGRGYPGRDFIRSAFREGRLTLSDLIDSFPEIAPPDVTKEEVMIGDRTMTFAHYSAIQLLMSPDTLPHAPEPREDGPPSGPVRPFVLDPELGKTVRNILARSARDMGFPVASPGEISVRRLGEAFLERLSGLQTRESSTGPRSFEPDPIVFLENELSRLGPELMFSEWLDLVDGSSIRERIDAILSDAAALYFDEGQAFWGLPGRENGFYSCFRALWSERPTILSEEPGMERWFASLPETPEKALLQILELWGIPREEWIPLFAHAFARLPGWAGQIKGMSERGERGKGYQVVEPAEWLAIRLSLEAFFADASCQRIWGVRSNRPDLFERLRRNPEEFGVRMLRKDPDLPLSLCIDIDDLIDNSRPGWGGDASIWGSLWSRIHASRNGPSEDQSLFLASMIKTWLALGESAPDPSSLTDGEIDVFREWFGKLPRKRFPLWGLLAYEKNYRDRLLEKLSPTRRSQAHETADVLGGDDGTSNPSVPTRRGDWPDFSASRSASGGSEPTRPNRSRPRSSPPNFFCGNCTVHTRSHLRDGTFGAGADSDG